MQLKDTTKTLLERIPAFTKARSSSPSLMSYDDDSPYLVYGDFGFFLAEQLKTRHSRAANEEVIRECFDLLGEMLTSCDPEIVNLAQVGVFETLIDSTDTLTQVKEYLRDNAAAVFEEWLSRGCK